MGKPLEITQDNDQNKNPQLMPDPLARAGDTVFYTSLPLLTYYVYIEKLLSTST